MLYRGNDIHMLYDIVNSYVITVTYQYIYYNTVLNNIARRDIGCQTTMLYMMLYTTML